MTAPASDVEKVARAIFAADWPSDLWEKHQDVGGVVGPDNAARRYLALASAALSALGERQWNATHQHRKGGLYRLIARGKMEADLSSVVIYEAQDGTTWVRPEGEFDDGRFTALRRPARGEG